MAAIDFPSSPSNGDTHTVGGVTYTYNSAETKWKTTINSNAFLPLTGGTVSGNILMGGEIQHDGDTDTNIAFGTNEIQFDTAGSERFRVGSAGQLGIGGATYGTSGQVLTSGGASAAPSWADAATPAAEVIAWVNYSSNGTIQDDVGISSITKGASGYYTANLDTSQADDNYAAVGSNGSQSIHCATPGTSSIGIIHVRRTDGAGVDHAGWIAAFR